MVTLESIDRKIENLLGAFGALNTKVDGLDTKFEEKFVALDKKVDAMDAKFENKIDAFDIKFGGRIDSMDMKFEGKFVALDKKIGAMDVKFENKMDAMDVKFENKMDAMDVKFENKIDELAAMTARGFLELRGEFKSDMHEVVHRLEVIEENYVTKDDFLKFSRNMALMLDKHIGAFRKDYDDLANRTKNLEKVVLATS